MKNFNITEWVDNFFDFNESNSDIFTAEDSKLFSNLVVMESIRHSITREVRDSFIFRLIEKRAAVVGLNCNDYFIAALAVISKTPAVAVMWVTAFRHLQDADNIIPGFPMRYGARNFINALNRRLPNDDHLRAMWESQKIKGKRPSMIDNWLDVIVQEENFIQATRDGFVKLGAMA